VKYFCRNLERDLRFSFLNQPSCPFPFLAQVSESECCFTCLPHLCMCCTDSFCCLKWSAVGFPWASWGGGGFSRKDCMLLIMLNLFSIFKSLSCYSEFVLVEGFFAGWCGKYWLSSWRRIVQVFLLEKEAKFFAFWLSLFIVYPWNLGAIVQILPWWIPCIGCWMPWSFSYDDSGLVWFCQLALKSFPSFLSFGVW